MTAPGSSNDLCNGLSQVEIGLLYSCDREVLRSDAERVHQQFSELLQSQLPCFTWDISLVFETEIPAEEDTAFNILDSLHSEKCRNGWDYAILLTDKPLVTRRRANATVLPSSALEVGIVSLSRMSDPEITPEAILVLLQYLLGSLLGLESRASEAMRPPFEPVQLSLTPFTEMEREVLRGRLEDVSDRRIEEKVTRTRGIVSTLRFYLHTFVADVRGIIADVIGYAPWKQPFQLGRLTAAAVVSMLFLFLGAEAWEIGLEISSLVLGTALVLSILISAATVYHGQDISDLLRSESLSEQLVRTKIVIVLCLVLGMTSLALVLLFLSFTFACVLPETVLARWTGTAVGAGELLKFAVFTTVLGTLAGALGGNLEESDVFREEILIDEII